MLLGIIADSHDNLTKIREAASILNRRGVELVLHAGDFIAPFTLPEFAKIKCQRFVGVFGNNDGEQFGLQKGIARFGELYRSPYRFEYQGKKILLLHEPDLLEPCISSQQFDLIVYGHLHELDTRREGTTMVINPGELGGWLYGKSTFVICDLTHQTYEIIKLDS
ncbi:MAG: metallophosphoesterase [Candidatus Aminicenantes bacterium]|nr:metallophosphoesterase [Candidatus Aminicenantes bacterium]MDH5715264.1 metallophosphoesterase [Candidatus Aminicenantes bacterium]